MVRDPNFTDDARINGEFILSNTTSDGRTVTFGTFDQNDRPRLVTLAATVQTDGTSRGEVEVGVDEDASGSATYSVTLAHIAPDNSTGTNQEDSLTVFVPAGGQLQVTNSSDPNGANSLDLWREVLL